MVQGMKWLKRLALGLTLLFVLELIFSYNGIFSIPHGTTIRTALLYLYCFLLVLTERIPIFSRKRDAVLGSLRLYDWALLVFLGSTALSILLIPRLSGAGTALALEEGVSFLILPVLYFPLSFMLRRREFSFAWLEQFLRFALLLFALFQIVLYVGQSINEGFITGVYDLFRRFFGARAVFPFIVMGHGGYPRIMSIASVYLLVGIYLVLRRLPRFTVLDGLCLAVHITALLATMTKSLWYGALLGIAVFSFGYLVRLCRKRQVKDLLRYAGILAGCFALIFALNLTIFDHMVSVRFRNSFTISSSGDTSSEPTVSEDDDLAKIDRDGAAYSNDIKIEQTKKLLKKWSNRPILGYGYGAYVEGYLRSDETPYSYEMQLPALLMKTGVVGVGLLGFVIVAMILAVWRAKKKGVDIGSVCAYFFLLVSFGFTVQTNPLLLSYSGMAVVLFLLLLTADIEQLALPCNKIEEVRE